MTNYFLILKKAIIPLFFLMLCGQTSAQMQNLATLAEGELEYSSLLFDTNKDLLGYIYFFNQGETSNRSYQYEYVYLDKNLNKVANGKYTEDLALLVTTSFISCTTMGDDQILLTKLYKTKGILSNEIVSVPFNRTISLKTSTVSLPFNFNEDAIRDFDLDPKKIRSTYKNTDSYFVIQGINIADKSHYVVFEFGKEKKYNYENGSLRIYKLDRTLLWEYQYNLNGSKKNWSDIEILKTTSKEIVLLEYLNSKESNISKKIVVLDIETGKKKFEYAFENEQSKFNHTARVECYEGKYYIIGHYSVYDQKNQYNWEKNLGVYQINLDAKGKEINRTYNPWTKIKSKIRMDQYGKLDDGYNLIPKNFFIFKNGSFSLLSEKYKKDKIVLGYHVLAKSQNFILFNFDTDGKFTGNQIIEKDKNRYILNNYLYSQYIKERQGVAFFFKNNQKDDETGEKNWVLGINTIIDGKFTQETIPMSSKSDEYFITPIPAKEGYILLREYNKNQKFNEIRLEKLNY